MRVWWPAVLASLAACSFTPGVSSLAAIDDGRGSDSGSGSGSSACLGSGLASICPRDPVPPTWTVAAPTDFDTGKDCDFTMGSLCVKQAIDVEIGDTLDVVGPAPLVIVAVHEVHVATMGVIDASSVASAVGPGANAPECAAGSPGTAENANSPGAGGGGGAGGSFGGAGGAGSSGSKPGGAPGATITASTIHGGCAGSAGGAQKSNPGGAPGDGGGAVYIIAGDAIAIEGVIDASGAGGRGGESQAGGGGGGAGGLIGLDAPSIHVASSAEIYANGGGGGGGGDPTPGASGADPMSATTPAAGGGDGGDGAAGTTLSGSSGTPRTSNGGGGGGGGAGVIKIFCAAPTLAGSISPPPT